ncbi:MAG: HEAT repeat domain-containing protein [Parachlamydiales bacterium]|nr:HEAT repeat domain-containing protein [Parachlamydiales bacterium]
MKKLLLLLFIPCFLIAYSKEDISLQRINSHILIEDYSSALDEAGEAIKKYPTSLKIKTKYIETLSLNGLDTKAIKELNKYLEGFPKEIDNHNLIEEICWGVIYKGTKSTQYQTRLTSSIGAYLTHDVRAVGLLKNMIKDSNAIIRTVALQLASSYMDKPIKDEIKSLFNSEKLWLVKLEVIKAIGNLKIEEEQEALKQIIGSDKATYEEKQYATSALANIKENISKEELIDLSKSPKAGLRKLACDLISYFNNKDSKDIILTLIKDPISDIRVSALNAFSLVYLEDVDNNVLKNILKPTLADSDPVVSITSAYIACLKNFDVGEKVLKKYLFDENLENSRFAASVLAHLTKKCNYLKKLVLQKHKDIYTKANIAIGLICEREYVNHSADVLFNFLKSEKEKIMLDDRKNPLFQMLIPSYIRHVDQIPNYPEAVDRMTRLNLLTMLAIIEDSRAQNAIKDFLNQKGWGITGFAAATLLKEGDGEALNQVKEVLKEKDEQIRVQAALVLALLGKEPSVIEVLKNAYPSADHELKIQILEALGNISDKDSIKFLIDVLDEPYQILRVVAASSIIRSING